MRCSDRNANWRGCRQENYLRFAPTVRLLVRRGGAEVFDDDIHERAGLCCHDAARRSHDRLMAFCIAETQAIAGRPFLVSGIIGPLRPMAYTLPMCAS
jgi:hypothetical protein